MPPLRFLLFGLLLTGGIGASAEPLFETTTVFAATPRNRPNYRIPALMTAANGDLLLFAEKRQDGIGDIGNHDLVLRRSTDRGRNWQPETVIFDDGDRASTDITLCLDRERGRIFLFFLRDKKRYVYFASDDHGRSWRGPVDIHASVTHPEWDRVGLDRKASSTADPESAVSSRTKAWTANWVQRYGVGPGAGGVQVDRGPHRGRLVIPARHLEADASGKLVTHSHVFFSDDHGDSWRLGPTVARHGNECRIVVLATGELMLNMRNATPADGPENSRRLVALSADGGDTWPTLYRDDALVSTTVHASLRVYDSPEASAADRGLVLFSNPASAIRQAEHPYGRYNLTVRWSRDHGRTWSAGRVIHAPPSSYSDLTVLDDGTIGLVYERGPKGGTHYWDELQFARFNLDWLFAPPHRPLR